MKRLLTLAAFAAFSSLMTPAIAPRAEPSSPAFPTEPGKVETDAQDQAWQKDFDTACGRTQDGPSRVAPDAGECQRLADREPRCLSYRDFASTYLDMRDGGALPANVAEGLKAMEKNTALYPPEFFNAVRRLYQIAFFTDREKLGTNAEFSTRAYRACISGHLM
jgi:hypothetical protein